MSSTRISTMHKVYHILVTIELSDVLLNSAGDFGL